MEPLLRKSGTIEPMHILLLARHYPPEVSGGARRPYLLVKALRAQGVRVTVVSAFKNTADPDHICVAHPVFGDAPPTHPARATTPARPTPLRDMVRQWLLWPDPEIRWCRKAAAAVMGADLKPDWLMTTSPPEASHVVGAQLAKALDLPWIAEFRDTWIATPHRKILETSPLRAAVERGIARRALARATVIVGVSEAVLGEIRNYAPQDVPALEIGHFSVAPARATSLPQNALNLVHTGGFSLSDRGRQIGPLLKAVEQAAQKRQQNTGESVHLHLAGRLTPEEKNAAQAVNGCEVSVYGEMPLEDAQALQAGADALILYTPPDSHALPGKYAEYRHAGRPILYLGGGSWLDLVDDPGAIMKLEDNLPSLERGAREGAPDVAALSADHAASQLLDVLKSIKPGA